MLCVVSVVVVCKLIKLQLLTQMVATLSLTEVTAMTLSLTEVMAMILSLTEVTAATIQHLTEVTMAQLQTVATLAFAWTQTLQMTELPSLLTIGVMGAQNTPRTQAGVVTTTMTSLNLTSCAAFAEEAKTQRSSMRQLQMAEKAEMALILEFA